ncbi:MAG TPA: dienelactone hydrolase family protein [Puia sp.]|nr:dienelactone hydrolase family protein [Puia sp.]
MSARNVLTAGEPLGKAEQALILVHGRGGSAEDILSLADHLPVGGYALLAPQAPGHTWYPYSFLAPPEQNQPWLTDSLQGLSSVVADVVAAGISRDRLFFAGFSQGACLTLEFLARHAARFGGVAAFTGGLIGDRIHTENYGGDFEGTPVFMGSGEPDPHVPAERVRASAKVLRGMGALVTEKFYPGRPHTITADELAQAGKLLFGQVQG